MKLPLEATIAGGYRFLFTRIVSIIGTVWLPYLLLFAGGGLCLWLGLPQGLWHGDFSQMHRDMVFDPRIQAIRIVFTLSAWIIAAMITVQLMRHALGLKQTTTFIHFSLAGPVWRMLVAFFLAGLILVPVIIAIILASIISGVVAGTQHMQPMHIVGLMTALAVVALILVLYICARLFFFLPAVVVAEERIGLGRAWELGKGNVLRIIAVWLCIVIPIWLFMVVVVGGTLFASVFAIVTHMPKQPTPEEVRPLVWAVLGALPIILPAAIIAGIAVRGYMAGAIGTAYKAVTAAKQESA